nr:hypothetical protein [Tanacetum cinerariifolium]
MGLVELPKGGKAIGSKWVWKIKYKSNGNVERYKARLVAKGFNQRERIDFDETFTHVVKIITVRCLINLVVQNGWTLYQMDVNNAFLYGDLNETVYMSLPPGYFPKDETKVCKLNKSLYRKYCLELINEFGLLASKTSYIPMQPNISLSSEPKDDDPLLDNVIDYQKLIGKLIYLTTTRPDIAYTVLCLSQFMHSPLKSYLKTALKAIRYLKGCPGKGVNVIRTSTSVNVLKAYTDADWARCTYTRRFVTGYYVFMNNSLVS